MSTNYSLYAIPVGWAFAIAPHFYAVSLTSGKDFKTEFNNVSPRDYLSLVRAQEKQSPIVQKYLRAESANANGFENLGFFAASVAIGNFAGVPTDQMNALAIGYLALRALYSILYIQTTSVVPSGLRSVTYVASMGACFAMCIKAGNIINAKLL